MKVIQKIVLVILSALLVNGDNIQRYIVKISRSVDTDWFLQNAIKFEPKIARHFKHIFSGFVADLNEKQLYLLKASHFVDFVEQDTIFTASRLTSEWNLDRLDQTQLPLDNEYSPVGLGDGVNVYVVDSGISFNHPEFDGSASFGYDALGGSGDDCNGHGTHCAGIIGGQQVGVARNVSMISVRVLNCQGNGYLSDILDGCEWLSANAITPAVVSMAMTGGESRALDEAVEALVGEGIHVVVAAGNNGDNACAYSPARVTQAITSGAMDEADKGAPFSNQGTCVDVFAPGVSVNSTWRGSSYQTISGTSVACSHVAGGLAIILGRNPLLTPSEAKQTLIITSVQGALTNVYESSPNRLLYVGQDVQGPNTPSPFVCSETITTNGSRMLSPNFPQFYSNNLDCTYLIQAPSSRSVELTFLTFDVEAGENCKYDALKIYDGESKSDPLLILLCGSDIPSPIVSTGQALFAVFTTDGSENGRGFEAEVGFVPSATPENGAVECSCSDTCTANTIQSPNFPADYNNNQICTYLLRGDLAEFRPSIIWRNFSVETSFSCRFDTVNVYDGDDDSAPLLGSYCGTTLPPPVAATGSSLFVSFVADSVVTAPGFLAEFQFDFVRNYCNETFTTDGDIFQSPNYPNNYVNNVDCRYTAIAPPGSAVTVTFETFDVEFQSSCLYDAVIIYDGTSTSDQVLALLCGSDVIPDPVTSTGNEMLVQFVTDGSVTNGGFSAFFDFS